MFILTYIFYFTEVCLILLLYLFLITLSSLKVKLINFSLLNSPYYKDALKQKYNEEKTLFTPIFLMVPFEEKISEISKISNKQSSRKCITNTFMSNTQTSKVWSICDVKLIIQISEKSVMIPYKKS